MVTASHSLSGAYSATCDVVPVIRHAVAGFAEAVGVERDQLDAVRLAVSEAVTNAVLHAYRGRSGRVHVTAHAVEGELWVLIADDGCGPHTPPLTPGLGFGLALITDACEQFTLVERARGGTEARMRFQTGGGESAAVTPAGR